MEMHTLPVWEQLMKRMVWEQLGRIQGKKIMDFGSGRGITASYLAADNEVLAIEPSAEMLAERWRERSYCQGKGSTEKLRELPNESFDVIVCHNVLEYAEDRETIVREFERLLKTDGMISLVKHNRAGRVMQMAVLLNDFEQAFQLLDGEDGRAAAHGKIHYFEDEAIECWSPGLKIVKTLGMRTFWDLQQNQEVQKEACWQEEMLRLEQRVSEKEEYKAIAFFHHLLIQKR